MTPNPQNNLNNLSTLTTQNNQSSQNNPITQITRNNQTIPNNRTTPTTPLHFLPQHGHYRHLRVYRVAEILYDLTYLFCQRFLSSHGDRTVDQMIQAARSGKQNIAEGNQAASTSSETEIKLTNVARASLEELLADYEDYLRTRSLPQWDKQHPRFEPMRQWTRTEDFLHQYTLHAAHMTDEELANLCLTLCHQTIYMLAQLIKTQQERFVKEGGIKERMYAARTGYRQQQDATLTALQQENASLRQRIAQLEAQLKQLNTQHPEPSE